MGRLYFLSSSRHRRWRCLLHVCTRAGMLCGVWSPCRRNLSPSWQFISSGRKLLDEPLSGFCTLSAEELRSRSEKNKAKHNVSVTFQGKVCQELAQIWSMKKTVLLYFIVIDRKNRNSVSLHQSSQWAEKMCASLNDRYFSADTITDNHLTLMTDTNKKNDTKNQHLSFCHARTARKAQMSCAKMVYLIFHSCDDVWLLSTMLGSTQAQHFDISVLVVLLFLLAARKTTLKVHTTPCCV